MHYKIHLNTILVGQKSLELIPNKLRMQVNIKSEFTINRRLWGINYNGRANDLIKDDVLIKLDVQYKS